MLCSVELEPADSDSLPGLYCDGDGGVQRRLPRVEEVLLNGGVLVEARGRDLVPAARVEAEGLAEFVGVTYSGARGRGDGISSRVRSAGERVREGLVLRGRRSGRGGDGQVGAFEVGGGEGGDVVPDRGGELGDGLLDLDGVVVGLAFVDFGYPVIS